MTRANDQALASQIAAARSQAALGQSIDALRESHRQMEALDTELRLLNAMYLAVNQVLYHQPGPLKGR